jgi:hypothetical protein
LSFVSVWFVGTCILYGTFFLVCCCCCCLCFFLMLFLVMGDLYCSIFCYLIYPSTLLFDLKKEKYKSFYVYITLVCLFHVSFFSISKRNLLKGAQGVVEPYTTKTVQIYHHSENNYSPSIKDCSNLPNHLHENRTNKKKANQPNNDNMLSHQMQQPPTS